MIASVTSRGAYSYSYHEYVFALVIRRILCCRRCKDSTQVAKLRRHEDAIERLDKELDMADILKQQRISKFVSKHVLKRYQLALIHDFKKYKLDNFDERESKKADKKRVTSSVEGHAAI